MSCGQAYDGHRSSWDTGENLGHLAISVGHQPTALVGHTFGGTPAALVGHTCHLVAIVSHLLLELVAHSVFDCPQTFLDFKTEDFHRGDDAFHCLCVTVFARTVDICKSNACKDPILIRLRSF